MTEPHKKMSQYVAEKAERKLKAQRQVHHTIWSGLGMMGLVGWAVVLPTLLGAMLGMWLDMHYPGRQSWALTFLIVGLCMGCVNAWHWVSKEHHAINQVENETDE